MRTWSASACLDPCATVAPPRPDRRCREASAHDGRSTRDDIGLGEIAGCFEAGLSLLVEAVGRYRPSRRWGRSMPDPRRAIAAGRAHDAGEQDRAGYRCRCCHSARKVLQTSSVSARTTDTNRSRSSSLEVLRMRRLRVLRPRHRKIGGIGARWRQLDIREVAIAAPAGGGRLGGSRRSDAKEEHQAENDDAEMLDPAAAAGTAVGATLPPGKGKLLLFVAPVLDVLALRQRMAR